MDQDITAPQDCMTMAEVRAGVDAIDIALMRLIGTRFRYMDAAARIKQAREAVRDEARKAQVIEHARRNAALNDVPIGAAAALWEQLVEASIDYEMQQFDRGL